MISDQQIVDTVEKRTGAIRNLVFENATAVDILKEVEKIWILPADLRNKVTHFLKSHREFWDGDYPLDFDQLRFNIEFLEFQVGEYKTLLKFQEDAHGMSAYPGYAAHVGQNTVTPSLTKPVPDMGKYTTGIPKDNVRENEQSIMDDNMRAIKPKLKLFPPDIQ